MYSPTTTIGNRLSTKITELKKDLGHSSKITKLLNKQFNDVPQSSGDNSVIKRLEQDIQRRQEMYVKQKREMQNEISQLQEQVKHYREMNVSSFNDSDQMKEIRQLHGKVLGNIDSVKNKTVEILQEQEKDLLRAFRARLFDIQSDLEKERNKRDEGAAFWIEKNRSLEKELDWIKEMADRLERVNQGLVKENQRLVSRCKTQEDDRELLVKRLVTAKKESSRFEQELQTVKEELEIEKSKKHALMKQLDQPAAIQNKTQTTIPSDVEERQTNLIKRLKKLLEIERKNVQIIKDQYNSELKEKTELEIFLKRCIEDVKEEINRRREEITEQSALHVPVRGPPSNIMGQKISPEMQLNEFTQKDRSRVMELLLSQERVISLLYDRTFPNIAPKRSLELPDITAKSSVSNSMED